MIELPSNKLLWLPLLGISLLMLGSLRTWSAPQPELGSVSWGRDFEAALKASAKSGKPVFALFQEVPGCAGCQQFGREVLSHPLLVEAIEENFVPVAIFNNRGGEDQKILERYGEPAWNYQVIRFLDGQGKDILPRKDRIWSIHGVAKRMIAALKKAGRPVPDYLKQVATASNGSRQQTGAFAMYCFWDGEAKLGRLPGVLNTEAGWLDGREVVRLTYDPEVIGWDQLVQTAESVDCAHHIYAPGARELKTAQSLSRRGASVFDGTSYRKAKASDQKRVLRNSPLAGLKLTPLQATKLNAELRFGSSRDVLKWLSPRQQREAQKLTARF